MQVFSAWFEKYGYKDDPLTIKPCTLLVARDNEIRLLFDNLVSGNLALLEGDAGLGKTSVLKSIEKKLSFSKDFEVHYFSMLDGFDGIKKLCEKPGIIGSFLLKIGLKKKRKKVILVDEAHLLLFRQAELLKNLFDFDCFHSLGLAFGEKTALNFSSSFKKRVCEEITLSKLSMQELKELLRLRLDGKNPLHEQTIDFLAKASDGNPRQFLLNCKKVCIKVHDFFSADNQISLEKAREVVLGKNHFFDSVKKSDSIEEKNCLENLTPLQKSILDQLTPGPMSLSELAQSVGASVGTIGKQVSVLCLNAKKEYMARKGIREPLIKKNKEQPTTMYYLSPKARELLDATANNA